MAARSLNGRPRRRHRRRRNHKERARIASSRIDESDRVLGLELDADDYLVKPYSFRELLARLKVVLRRTRRSSRTRPQPDLALTRRSDVDPKRPRLILTVRGEGYRFTERVSWTSVRLTPFYVESLSGWAGGPRWPESRRLIRVDLAAPRSTSE